MLPILAVLQWFTLELRTIGDATETFVSWCKIGVESQFRDLRNGESEVLPPCESLFGFSEDVDFFSIDARSIFL